MIRKLPEKHWKRMRFCLLSIIHILGNYEEENVQCAELLMRMKKYHQILNSIPFLEWKIGFHFRIECRETGEGKKNGSDTRGVSKKDIMKLKFLWMHLLFLVRACSEKSFERTHSPRLKLTGIRKKLIAIRDGMSEDFKIIEGINFQDDGKKYTFDIELRTGEKPDWH